MAGYRFRSASSRNRVASRPAMSARAAIRPRSVRRPSSRSDRRRRRKGSRKPSSPKLGIPVSRQAPSSSRRSSSDTSSTPARSSVSPTRLRARTPVRSNADVTSMLNRAPCRFHGLASRSRDPASLPDLRAAGAPRAGGRGGRFSPRAPRRADAPARSLSIGTTPANVSRGLPTANRPRSMGPPPLRRSGRAWRYRSAAMVKLSKTVQPSCSNCLRARGDICPESQAVRWGALRSSRCATRAVRSVHAM